MTSSHTRVGLESFLDVTYNATNADTYRLCNIPPGELVDEVTHIGLSRPLPLAQVVAVCYFN
jgi:hypothetical protein